MEDEVRRVAVAMTPVAKDEDRKKCNAPKTVPKSAGKKSAITKQRQIKEIIKGVGSRRRAQPGQ